MGLLGAGIAEKGVFGQEYGDRSALERLGKA